MTPTVTPDASRAERMRFLKSVLTGGFAALVNVGVRILLSLVMSYEMAVFVAYLIAMVTAYALSRVFVFERSGRSVGEELTKFTIVNIVALVQVWPVTMGMNYYALPWIGWTFHTETVAHLCGVVSPVFTSYLGHKYFSFGAKAESSSQPEA